MSPIVMIALGILACVILYRVAQAMSRPGAKPSQSMFSPSTPSAPNAAGVYGNFKEVVTRDGGRYLMDELSRANARREARTIAEDLSVFIAPPSPTQPPSGGPPASA